MIEYLKMAEEVPRNSREMEENEKFEDDANDIENMNLNNKDKSDPLAWIRSQIDDNADPRIIINHLIPELTVPDHVDDITLWRIALKILSEPPVRKRLLHVNSLEHVKQLLKDSTNIIVLTGAGVSVSCGIPDFRSRDGIYARLSQDYPDLPDPQAMFDIHYFRVNQWPFFKFAKEIYPGQFTPSLCHRFISYLDKTGRLLRNYSQNIDTLEQVAGIKNVVQCHGSFATATCMNCKYEVNAEDIRDDIFQQKIPYCSKCTLDDEDENALNILKPGTLWMYHSVSKNQQYIVFFGESLPKLFHQKIEEDKEKADLLIVIGSSLKVRPVALIPSLVNKNVPQILINREPLNHMSFDVELYGNCDDVIAQICTQLGSGWADIIGDFVLKPLDSKKLALLFNDDDNDDDDDDDEKNDNYKECNVKIVETKLVEGDIKFDVPNCEGTTKPEVDVSSVDKPTTVQNESESKTFPTTNETKLPKRKCACGNDNGDNASPKKPKLHRDPKCEEKEDVYYLSLPPNRYLFNGAELEMEDNESESDSEVDANESVIASVNETNGLNGTDHEPFNEDIDSKDIKETNKQNSNVVEATGVDGECREISEEKKLDG